MSAGADEDPAGSSGEHPVRHSRRLSDELVEDARRLFQKRTDRKITSEDARQILENLTGFFSILHEWDRVRGSPDKRNVSRKNDRDPSS